MRMSMDTYVPTEWVVILLSRLERARRVSERRMRVIQRARWRALLRDLSEDMPSDENHL